MATRPAPPLNRLDACRALLSPLAAAALLAGALAPALLSKLPAPAWLALIFVLAVAALIRFPRWRLVAWFLIGFAWFAWRADVALGERLPKDLEGRDIDVIGVVSDLPMAREDATRFSLRIEHATIDGEPLDLRGLARVSWYRGAPAGLDACDRWRLRLRLKRPRGLLNPGAFDFERLALERGVVAVGYVREDGENELLGEQGLCIDRLRAGISRDIARIVANAHDVRLLQAFSIGDTRGLDSRDWEIARANGIPHLIAISGFHVGVAAIAGVFLVNGLWWLFPGLARRVPLPLAQAPAALMVAIAYGALAGGSLPTVRTVLMIAVVALTRLSRRSCTGAQSLALALFAIVLFDPLSVLSAGFWLSFVGVAFLMLCMLQGHGMLGFLRELSLGQIVMTIALLPLTVWFFGEASLVGALSNLIAVPFVSFVIVPLCLLGVLCLLLVAPLAPSVLVAAGWLAHAQWWLLEVMARWPRAHWYLPEVTPVALLLAMVGAVWLFVSRGVPARALSVLLFLPLVYPALSRPAPGSFEAMVIDVGQGLSVFVRTHEHALLFDAGARYPSQFDLGEVAVLPALRAAGIDRLDVLMISHADNDHAGGAPAVAAAFPAARRYAGEPARSPIAMEQCSAGQKWSWDGVQFRVVGPPQDLNGIRDGNDRSCVLMVESPRGRLLLTGDMSARMEPAVAQQIEPGPPLVLIAAHHGSKTSSSAAFLDAVQPHTVVFSAGYRSRFGHPHPQVVARFAERDIRRLDTASGGLLHLRFDTDPPGVTQTRETRSPFWREH